MRRYPYFIFLWVILLAQPGLAATELDSIFTGNTPSYSITITSSLKPLAINRIHQWTVHLKGDLSTSADLLIAISGGMPAHNHGLPTNPQMTARLGNGKFLIEGIKFHMPGLWEIKLVIQDGEKFEELSFELHL